MIKRNIPNAITLMNLLAGTLAILFILNEKAAWGTLCIAAALILDFLDGTLARLLHAQTPIGVQLDSLADLVSFGVAPGFILWSMMHSPEAIPDGLFHQVLPYTALLLPLFSAIRLARFNIDTSQRYTFRGLPTPSTAIFVGSLPLISSHYAQFPVLSGFLMNQTVLFLITVLLSFLMVAPVNLLSLKFKDASWRANWPRYVLLLFSAGMILFYRIGAFPIIILFYILISLVSLPQGAFKKK